MKQAFLSYSEHQLDSAQFYQWIWSSHFCTAQGAARKAWEIQVCMGITSQVFILKWAWHQIFIILLERAFKMMKNGVYFIVIALLAAELFKILIYAN